MIAILVVRKECEQKMSMVWGKSYHWPPERSMGFTVFGSVIFAAIRQGAKLSCSDDCLYIFWRRKLKHTVRIGWDGSERCKHNQSCNNDSSTLFCYIVGIPRNLARRSLSPNSFLNIINCMSHYPYLSLSTQRRTKVCTASIVLQLHQVQNQKRVK